MKAYTEPQSIDVLGGRGSKAFHHTGNRWLRKTIVELLESYKKSKKGGREKSSIVRNIIEIIREEGRRFLKFDKDAQQWYDAGFNEARLKIGHAFRDASLPNKVKCFEAVKAMQEEEIKTIDPLPCSQLLAGPLPLHRVSLTEEDLHLHQALLAYHDHLPQHHGEEDSAFCEELAPSYAFCYQPDDTPSPRRSSFSSISLVDGLLKDLDEESDQDSTSSIIMDDLSGLLIEPLHHMCEDDFLV